MKKLVTLTLAIAIATSTLVGCKQQTSTPEPAPAPATETPAAETPAAEGTIAKVGLGQNISIAKSSDKTAEKNAAAQADVTMAAVGFDADGKVVSVTLDVVQPKVAFDENMKVTSDLAAEIQSKIELKDAYGMKKASQIGKEWYEQAAAFEEWMIGKTVEEITGLPLKDGKADDPELTSSVTVSVDSYIAAVEEAWNNAVDATGAVKVGLGSETTIEKSKDATADKPAAAQMDTTMTATAVDADGKVVAAIVDVAQVKVAYDAEGKVTTDKAAEIQTKVELGEKYGMVNASSIKKEWFEQMAAFQEWMVGKTVEDINGLKVKERDESHKAVPDVPELTSSVTITVDPYQAVVTEAVANAK